MTDLTLKLETRKRLFEVIRSKPGIHFREVHRESGLAMGELEYHLRVLEKMEVVVKRSSAYHSRYYPSDELRDEEKELIGVLRQKMLRNILVFLISEKRCSHGGITEKFELVKSTTSFYLKKLLANDLIDKTREGRKVYYRVPEPRKILRLILLYKEGFGDELAARVEKLWANL